MHYILIVFNKGQCPVIQRTTGALALIQCEECTHTELKGFDRLRGERNLLACSYINSVFMASFLINYKIGVKHTVSYMSSVSDLRKST